MKIEQLQYLDYKQLQSLRVLHSHLLDFFFFISQADKTAVRFSFTIRNEHGNSDVEYYTLSTIGYPEEIPREFQTFLEDYCTRLIAERTYIDAALEDLAAAHSFTNNQTL